MTQQSEPGVSRDDRISEEGLDRLRKQLSSGVKIRRPVLEQWIKRYGEAARTIIAEFDKSFRY